MYAYCLPNQDCTEATLLNSSNTIQVWKTCIGSLSIVHRRTVKWDGVCDWYVFVQAVAPDDSQACAISTVNSIA